MLVKLFALFSIISYVYIHLLWKKTRNERIKEEKRINEIRTRHARTMERLNRETDRRIHSISTSGLLYQYNFQYQYDCPECNSRTISKEPVNSCVRCEAANKYPKEEFLSEKEMMI